MSVRLFATRHSHAELFVHAVWTTRNRSPLLEGEDLVTIGAVMQSTAKKLGAIVCAAGGTEDHVHVLVRYRPDITVSSLVRALKASASHFVRRSSIRDFAWQEGYAAFSVSGKDVDRVEAYVLSQKERHAQGNTWDEQEPG